MLLKSVDLLAALKETRLKRKRGTWQLPWKMHFSWLSRAVRQGVPSCLNEPHEIRTPLNASNGYAQLLPEVQGRSGEKIEHCRGDNGEIASKHLLRIH